MQGRTTWTGMVTLALAAAFAWTTRAAETTTTNDVGFLLQMENALYRDKVVGDGPSLSMDLARRGGVWSRILGSAPGFNKGVHEGLVLDGTVSDEAIALKLLVQVGGDSWVPGGRAEYRVALKRADKGRYEGTFAGTMRGHELRGPAHATLAPAPVAVRPDRQPFRPGEHPRLLFRQADLPALREKAKTPFGEAAMAKMTGVIGLSLKHALTGDAKLAEQVMPMVEKLMADDGVGDKMVRGRILGWRMEQVALAYDLCYAAWPAEFRQKVQEYVVQKGWRPFLQLGTFQKEINWHMTSAHPGPIRYGVALAALAIWGEPGPEPVKPAASAALAAEPAPAIPPADGYTPPQGVPVNAYTNGTMPPEWIYVAGFKPQPGEDPLAALGGGAKARPEVGTTLAYGGRTETFRPLARGEASGHLGDKIDAARASGRVWHSTSYFYTVIRNDRPRLARVQTGDGRDTVYLAGVPVREGAYVRLAPGLYPLLFAAPIGMTSEWGAIFKQPRLTDATPQDLDDWIAFEKTAYADRLLEWEYDHARWKRSGGGDVRGMRLFEVAHQTMYEFYREGIGAGGYQGIKLFSLEGPNKYAVAHRNAFNADASSFPDIAHFLPRKMFTFSYLPDGKSVDLEIEETKAFQTSEYFEHYDTAANVFGVLFPLTPDALKPAVLWAWQRQLGIAGPADAAKALSEASRPTTGYPSDSHPAWVFVNYPLDLAARPPADVMPLTWEAPGYGWYAFRNSWRGERDIVLQTYLRAGATGGENAGCFRLLGLGREWAVGGCRMRMFENVVQLADNTISPDARGRLLHVDRRSDGSGSVTMDLNDVYAAPTGRPQYERTGNLRLAGGFGDSGVRGLRAFGVDYSGKSGAPCLLAVADKIEGGKNPVWWWPFTSQTFGVGGLKEAAEYKQKDDALGYPGLLKKFDAEARRDVEAFKGKDAEWAKYAAERAEVLKSLKTEGNAFTFSKGAATLKGTVISPATPKIQADDLQQLLLGAKCSLGFIVCSGLAVRGGESYFVVATLQEGEPPKVESSGAGLDAKVRVGGQTVRFDGQKIVFGE